MAFDVLNKNLVGSLIDKQENHASQDNWVIRTKKDNLVTTEVNQWKVEAINEMDGGYYSVVFKSRRVAMGCKLKGVGWIGKYFYASGNSSARKEVHYCCIALSDEA